MFRKEIIIVGRCYLRLHEGDGELEGRDMLQGLSSDTVRAETGLTRWPGWTREPVSVLLSQR